MSAHEHEPLPANALPIDGDPASKKPAIVTLGFSIAAAVVLAGATASLFLTESCTPSSSTADPTAAPGQPTTTAAPTTPPSGPKPTPTPPPTNHLPPPPT